MKYKLLFAYKWLVLVPTIVLYWPFSLAASALDGLREWFEKELTRHLDTVCDALEDAAE